MMIRGYRTGWIEVAAGVLFLALALGAHFRGGVPAAEAFIALFIVGTAASFVIHALLIWPAVFVLALFILGSAWAGAALLGAVLEDALLLAFALIYGSAHLVILWFRYRNRDAGGGERRGKSGFLALAGLLLFGFGAAAAAEAVAPEWFRLSFGGLPASPALSVFKGLFLAAAGTSLLAAERRERPGSFRAFAGGAAFLLLSAVALLHAARGETVSGAALAALAGMLLLALRWPMVRLGPPREGREEIVLAMYGFEVAGKIALWLSIAWGGAYFLLSADLKPGLFLAAIAGSTFIGLVSWHAPRSEPVSAAARLLVLLGHTAAYAVVLEATGGLASPYVLFAFVLAFAGSVIVPPRLVAIPVLALIAVFSASLLASAAAAGSLLVADFREFVFIAAALVVTGFFTYVIAARRERNEARLNAVNQELQATVRQVEEEKEKNRRRAERLRRVNEELLEMRSALLNVLEDVEESKRSLEADHLREAAIFDAIGDGLVAADADGRVVVANPAAEKILRAARAEIVGRPVEQVLRFRAEGEKVLRTELVRDAYRGKGGRLGEKMVIEDASGRLVPVAGTVMPFYGVEKDVSGIVAAFRDVAAERELDERKSGFISVASHQLRTLLSAIRWYLDLLLDGEAGKLTRKQKEYLDDVHASAVRMAALVNDLLQVSSLEEGQLRARSEEFDGRELLRSAASELMPLIAERSQKFELDVPEEPLPVKADRSLLRQTLINLLSNAAKYTPKRGRIGARVRRGKDEVVFEVWDTGQGIPYDETPFIFEKFHRGEKAVTTETVGSGLGLYIAKRLVEGFGGRIWFETEAGKGTTFFVAMPGA